MSVISEGAVGVGAIQNMFGEAQSSQLLRAAADYAARSITSVVTQLEEDQSTANRVFYEMTRLMHSLEVHYLFPNLGEQDRSLVASLLGARNAMLMGIKKLERRRGDSLPAEAEAVITHLRNRFDDLKTQVEYRGLADKLTIPQRAILDQEFLSLPLAA